jgi:hypothetical protein
MVKHAMLHAWQDGSPLPFTNNAGNAHGPCLPFQIIASLAFETRVFALLLAWSLI